MTCRVLAFIEAETITGPAKNLLQFASMLKTASLDPELEVAVAAFVREGRPPNQFLAQARKLGIQAFEIPERGRFDRHAMEAMRAAVESSGAHLVQTHAVKSHFLCRLAGLHKTLPWIAFHHGYTWPDMRARMYNELDRWSLRAASQVLTVSKPFAEQLVQRGVAPTRIEIIHNAIDARWGTASTPDERAELRQELGIAAEVPVLLIVGRLSREKDHETLLRAMERVPNAHLVVVGDGPERSAIERTVMELGLTGRVTLAGHQPTAEPFYAIADIAVLSSRTEGSPNALLEAMAAGVPSVATRVGGVPEIATDSHTALLVPAGDIDALGSALARLIEDRAAAREMAERAQKHVRENHSPEARMRRLWTIYKRFSGA